jgi:hypothetical protein
MQFISEETMLTPKEYLPALGKVFSNFMQCQAPSPVTFFIVLD